MRRTRISTSPDFARRALMLGFAGAAVATAAHAAAPASTWSPEEERAIGVVREWIAALVAKDVDKAVSLADDDISYRDDPNQKDLKKGSVRLRKDLKLMVHGLGGVTVNNVYAVGSPKNDVLVLVRRTDTFVLGNNSLHQPIGGYYRVRNGKILEWLDTPLVEMPPMPKGPPPGAPHP